MACHAACVRVSCRRDPGATCKGHRQSHSRGKTRNVASQHRDVGRKILKKVLNVRANEIEPPRHRHREDPASLAISFMVARFRVANFARDLQTADVIGLEGRAGRREKVTSTPHPRYLRRPTLSSHIIT